MSHRLEYLESQQYEGEHPFFADDLKGTLEEIYHPRDVEDISNMDNNRSYEYLVALDNEGFLAESVDLGDGISMETMDPAIEERDLHYLHVQVSTVKPFVAASIWKYLKQSADLVVLHEASDYGKAIEDSSQFAAEYGLHEAPDYEKIFEDLSLFAKEYELTEVEEEDLESQVMEDQQPVSFYKKYFDEYAEE